MCTIKSTGKLTVRDMIAQLRASSTDGQRVELTAVVLTCGAQTMSKTGTPKRVAVLTDPTGTIELAMLSEGSVQSENPSRGHIVIVKNAKVSVWNGITSLLLFTAPTITSDDALEKWWMGAKHKHATTTVQTILTLPDQQIVYGIDGLVVSTEEASATKSGGTKRKFTLADGSTPSAIEVCFVGKQAIPHPNNAVGSIVALASAKVGVWNSTRSLLIFDPPSCTDPDDASVAGIHEWVRSGGAAIHGPVTLVRLRETDDDQRVDLLPIVVSPVYERTMTTSRSLWKRKQSTS